MSSRLDDLPEKMDKKNRKPAENSFALYKKNSAGFINRATGGRTCAGRPFLRLQAIPAARKRKKKKKRGAFAAGMRFPVFLPARFVIEPGKCVAVCQAQRTFAQIPEKAA